jgi:SPFH domain / Band 7 family
MDIFRQGRGDNAEFTLKPAFPGLRNIVIGVAVVLVALFLLSFAVRITRIEAGHVGVEINLAGRQRGASETPVRTGWVLYSPLTTQIIEFPTYVQTVKWTKDVNEGHQVNEEMGFNSKEGMEILVDVRCPMPSSPPRLRIFMSSTAWVSWTSSRTEFYAISCAILSTR